MSEEQIQPENEQTNGQSKKPMTQAEFQKIMKQQEEQRKMQLKQAKTHNDALAIDVEFYTLQASMAEQRNRIMEYYMKNRIIEPEYVKATQEDQAKIKAIQEAKAAEEAQALKPESKIITM